MTNLSYRTPQTEVKKSRIHGRGLFAKSAIRRGEVVAVKGGYILPAATWNKFERDLGAAEIQISDGLFIAPVSRDQREGSMVYLNHSCDPNCAIQGQIVFVAMKNVEAGEELTHDWATTDDLEYELECNCGSPECRGTIAGDDWKRSDLQHKYKGWFCWHIQQKIDSQ